ncbi:hypothetical protein [Hyalangium minutum]|uniref:Uncharacterized protein n=1 Tax=Hyalangium minutum TaxID=394096 RepID=A0A085WND7_9BACT|nr:hypothetical protein [Hyalangium minutum]KFE69200.1 hypothetical protein DB31_7102 [Hyalangium minutum]
MGPGCARPSPKTSYRGFWGFAFGLSGFASGAAGSTKRLPTVGSRFGLRTTGCVSAL